mmetsp:Transcript_41785/g.110126  ORF Transcript_41785/g.110126 Transcript_41785/m.110126 type:complete len:211 (+) Transcript_41785:523-1155(+)
MQLPGLREPQLLRALRHRVVLVEGGHVQLRRHRAVLHGSVAELDLLGQAGELLARLDGGEGAVDGYSWPPGFVGLLAMGLKSQTLRRFFLALLCQEGLLLLRRHALDPSQPGGRALSPLLLLDLPFSIAADLPHGQLLLPLLLGPRLGHPPRHLRILSLLILHCSRRNRPPTLVLSRHRCRAVSTRGGGAGRRACRGFRGGLGTWLRHGT